jgi:hypothetical protein
VGGQALAAAADKSLAMSMVAEEDSQTWHLLPLGNGLFRIYSDAWGRRWSLASRPEDTPQLVRTSDSVDQLWRVSGIAGDPSQLALAAVGAGMPPRVLAYSSAGRLAMRPRGWGAGFGWRLEKVRVWWPPAFVGYRFVSREIRPHPPLPPARLELANSHSKELWVLLADRLAGGMRLKVPAGKSVPVTLERDAGATLVEVYEQQFPDGTVQREEFVTELPPAPRYDLSVYELIVQSIAIDRTVPGGKLEDVQHSPRSLGWFELPPGDQLADGPLDVYGVAVEQNNPGVVRRINPADWQPRAPGADPVESLLEKFRAKSRQ